MDAAPGHAEVPPASSPEPARQDIRLRLATDALGVGVFEVVNGVPVWENDCVYRIFGRDRARGPIHPQEFVERVLHPDDLPALVQAFRTVGAEGTTLSVPCRIRRQDDGAWRWIEFTVHARALGDGSRRTVGVVSDVTERVEALRRLRESEQRYRTLFDTLPGAVFIVDADGRLHSFNDAACQLLGYRAEEMAQMPLWGFVTQPDEATLRERLRGQLAQAGKHEYASTYRRRDGRLLDVQVSAQTVSLDGQAFVLAAVADLTAQKEAERALLLDRARLELALQAGRMGAWQWNVSSASATWSEGLYELTGLPRGSGVEPLERFLGLVHEDDRERVQQNMALLMERERMPAMEHRIRRPDGAIRWLSSSGRTLRDAAGCVHTVVGVTADITERKLMELELREAARRKDEFLAMLSHELRNPLAPIATSVNALRRGVSGERAETLHRIIERQARHLTHLVDDLLDATRIATGRIVLRPEPMWLADAVRAALDTLAPQLAERGQEVRVHSAGTPQPLVADPTRLTQILVNLLHNASKFSEPGAPIELHTDEQSDAVVIQVIDQGAGIEPAALPRLFDLFVQGSDTLDRSQGGLGIGLALVKGLAALHGGTVEAASAGRGRGASFTVRLPRSAAPAKTPADGAAAA
jgi:two-component system CheB/CheR fusion protein